MNKDPRALAFVNLFAILGALEPLCQLVPEAKALIAEKKIALAIAVKNGPEATLCFDHGNCSMVPGVQSCQIKLPFSTPEKFNGMIDGTTKPFPSKGFTKLGFLLHEFTNLTNILTHYLRPNPEDLRDETFFRRSTLLMLHVIAGAVAQLGNEDPVSQQSASYIPDGIIRLSIPNESAVGILAKDHHLSVLRQVGENYTSAMEFQDIRLARDLFDGKVNSVACVGMGQVTIKGMIPQVDNLNRILDRVAVYLA